jgi:hypothetical protein
MRAAPLSSMVRSRLGGKRDGNVLSVLFSNEGTMARWFNGKTNTKSLGARTI